MTAATVDNVTEVLKEHYAGQRVPNLVYKNEPTLAVMPKMENMTGELFPLPIQYGVPQGRSATFSTAQSNATPSKFKNFHLTRVKDYAVATIDNELAKASANDVGSFLRMVTTEVNGALKAATRSLATAMFRTGTGSVGQIGTVTDDKDITDSSDTSKSLVKLKKASDVTNFEVGQKVGASASDGGSIRNSAYNEITSINRRKGWLEIGTGDVVSADSWAADDYLHVEGDALNGGSTDTKLAGFADWLPVTAPSSGESFFNVDRSVDSRLYGVHYDGTGDSIREALIEASKLLGREGGSPSHCVVNHDKFAELLKEMEGDKIFDSVRATGADISFDTIKLHTTAGVIQVMADHNCPVDRAYLLQMDTWKLFSLGPAPQILTYMDGHTWVRESTSDSMEVRVGYYAQMGCNAPGYNCVIELADTDSA